MTESILAPERDFSNSPSDNSSHLIDLAGTDSGPVCSRIPDFQSRFDSINIGMETKSVIVTKGDRFALLNNARIYTPDLYKFGDKTVKNRSKYCLKCLTGEHAEIRERTPNGVPSGMHYWSGAKVCGGVHLCPVCSAVIRSQKSAVIQHCINRHLGEGGSVCMLTLTIPHVRSDSLSSSLDDLSSSVLGFWKSRACRELLRSLGYVDSIRNLEITWGAENGWHPHNHFLLFLRDDVAPVVLADQLYPIYRNFALKRTGKLPSREHGLNVIRGESAAEYLAKSGISADKDLAREISHSHTKLAKSDRLTPFGILARLDRDDCHQFLRLWCEYAVGTHGKHAIGRFDALRALYLSDLEEDRILSAETESILKTLISKPIYAALYDKGLLGEAIRLFNAGGNLSGILKLIR